jgi:hypothetical protein
MIEHGAQKCAVIKFGIEQEERVQAFSVTAIGLGATPSPGLRRNS